MTKAPGAQLSSPYRLAIAAALAAFSVLAFSAGEAKASILATTQDCDNGPVTQPFSAWGDLNDYVLAPDGGVENGANEWNLAGGAQIVSGNEPFYLRDEADTHSVRVPSGGAAETATMCIGQEHPTLRFVAKNESGSWSSVLFVQIVVETARGRELSIPIGIERGNANWEPSTAMKLWVNYLNMAPGTYTPVEFLFTAKGGSWLIDDVFVDPRHH